MSNVPGRVLHPVSTEMWERRHRTRVPTPDCLLRTTATSAAPFLLLLLLLLLFVPQSTRSFVLGHSTLLSLVQQLGRFNIYVLRGSALCVDPVHWASGRFVCGSQQFSRIGYHFQLTVRVARRYGFVGPQVQIQKVTCQFCLGQYLTLSTLVLGFTNMLT